MDTLLYPYENYFSLKDLVATGGWLLLLSLAAVYIAFQQRDRRDTRLYLLNFGFKVVFALVFALAYIVLFNGGDTLAYWDGAVAINKLFYVSPSRWFEHLTSLPDQSQFYWFFNQETGYPPTWIYKEPESYFICKINSFFVTITFQSYLSVTLIWAFIMAHVNWKLFILARRTELFSERLLPYAVLFLPSVAFACAGISKDTVVFISLILVLICMYRLIYERQQHAIWKLLPLLLFSSWILLESRGFIFGIILVSALVAAYTYFIRKIVQGTVPRLIYRIVFLFIAGAGTVYLAQGPITDLINSNEYFQQAVITQQDFKNNQFYGKNQYSLGDIELTPWGIIKAVPISIVSGLLEPFPWHALNLSLFISGIESLLFLLLVARWIITGRLIKWVQEVRRNEVLVFMLVFVLLMAYISGFTSIIYGVLIRIRAPLLPFWAMLLILDSATIRKSLK